MSELPEGADWWPDYPADPCHVVHYWPTGKASDPKRYKAVCRRCDFSSYGTPSLDRAVDYALRHRRTRQHIDGRDDA